MTLPSVLKKYPQLHELEILRRQNGHGRCALNRGECEFCASLFDARKRVLRRDRLALSLALFDVAKGKR